MARKPEPLFTSAPPAPAGGVRARTYRQLLDSGMRLMQARGLVSVAEIAADAGVSRATAYRYFPSRSRLVSAVVEESLGPVRGFESARTDGRARLRDLFDQTFPRLKVFEPQLRAALQLALQHWAMERASVLAEERFRRGYRMQILQRAAHPLQQELGAARYDKLLRALSLVYGIEPYVVLKDMWGMKDREVEDVSRWVMDALINAALAEVRGGRPVAKPVATKVAAVNASAAKVVAAKVAPAKVAVPKVASAKVASAKVARSRQRVNAGRLAAGPASIRRNSHRSAG